MVILHDGAIGNTQRYRVTPNAEGQGYDYVHYAEVGGDPCP